MAQVINGTAKDQQTAKVAGYRLIPILLTDHGMYLTGENRYLRERANGEWLSGKYVDDYGERRELVEESMLAHAKDLSDFHSHQEWRNDFLLGHQPAVVLRTYRAHMRRGVWTRVGRPIAKSTWTRRSSTAEDFTRWLEANAYIKVSERNGNKGRDSPQSCEKGSAGRSGKAARLDPEELDVPKRKDTDAWLASVYSKSGVARGKACFAILAAGLRLQEAALIRADQLPNIDPVRRWGRIKISFGAKGGRVVGDTERKGKVRKVLVSREDLKELIRYRDGPRKIALARFREQNPGQKDPVELFLDERTGRPLTEGTIYRAWTGSKGPIQMGWSPHLGRHVYAMRLLLAHLRLEDEADRFTRGRGARANGRAVSVLEFIVQPSLGHNNSDTTKRYLRMFQRLVGDEGFAVAYADHLAGADKT